MMNMSSENSEKCLFGLYIWCVSGVKEWVLVAGVTVG